MMKLFCGKNKNDEKEGDSPESKKNIPDGNNARAPKKSEEKSGKVLWQLSVHRLIKIIAILLSVDVVVSICALYFDRDFSPVVDMVAFALVSILLFALFTKNGFSIIIRKSNLRKDDCTFLSKEECPYASIKDCPHNTTHCCAFKPEPRNKWKINVLALVMIGAFAVYIFSFLIKFPADCEGIEIIKNICLSVIVASVMAFLVDIPGKMKEYQSYFVDLLSSNEYLKHMSEEDLSQLRKSITRVQHSKDVKCMPKGLIKFDESVCEMLRSPFYKEYRQITTVELTEETGILEKKVIIHAVAFNPYRNDKPVKMDIGFNHSIIIPVPKDVEWGNMKGEIRKYFSIKRFDVSFGDDIRETYDLKKFIKIVYRDAVKDGSDYNCLIYVLLDDRIKDLCLESLKYGLSTLNAAEQNDEMSIEYQPNIEKDNLIIEFLDKIRFTLEYELKVPQDDILYTKSLRYPVQHFALDYSLTKGMEKYKLYGLLMGSMLEYPNSTVRLSNNERTVSLQTSSWLLPKNGAIIVHNKTDDS